MKYSSEGPLVGSQPWACREIPVGYQKARGKGLNVGIYIWTQWDKTAILPWTPTKYSTAEKGQTFPTRDGYGKGKKVLKWG